mgnify:CR=1 FL=1
MWKSYGEKNAVRNFIKEILRDFIRNHAQEESKDKEEKNQQVTQTNNWVEDRRKGDIGCGPPKIPNKVSIFFAYVKLFPQLKVAIFSGWIPELARGKFKKHKYLRYEGLKEDEGVEAENWRCRWNL